MTDIFENVLKKIKAPAGDTPFSRFGLRSIKGISSDDIMHFFVNYEVEMTKLLNHIVSISNDKPTARIALIGPSGSGKTTLLQYLLLKINTTKLLDEFKDALKSVNFVLGFYAKGATEDILRQQYENIKRGSGGVIIIDDMHEIFIKEESETAQKFISMLSNETKNNVIITTWLPNGWSNALSKHPEIKNLFDDVIFIKGIGKDSCMKLIKKRFKRCSVKNENVPEESVAFEPFTKDAIEKIIEIGCPNPRIIIEIIERSIKYAYKNNLNSISDKDIDSVLSMLGYNLYPEKFNNLSSVMQSMVRYCLVATTLSMTEICEISKKQRPNVSNYMNELKDMGFFEKETVDNESVFTMAPILRYQLETELMKEVEIISKK